VRDELEARLVADELAERLVQHDPHLLKGGHAIVVRDQANTGKSIARRWTNAQSSGGANRTEPVYSASRTRTSFPNDYSAPALAASGLVRSSANLVRIWSVFFSSSRVATSSGTASLRPSSSAQLFKVP
jgi:hypothetical protein